jgi:hypothetical protein
MPDLNYYRGDTWLGCIFTTVYNGGSPPSPAESARLQFRKGVYVHEVSTEGADPKLEITDAAEWTITALPHVLPIEQAGDWEFDLEITDEDGNVTTTAKGTLIVEADVTR